MKDQLNTRSPFRLDESSEFVATVQMVLGVPETGIWTIADELAYEEHMERVHWMSLAPNIALPRNWYGSFRKIRRTI